ncbi:hypothetical protein V9T40_005166 [Parthenolecanium corni]|uniref:Uncharacterized protein n=1 Tax=Parthenolecanium corni TaxID=536013 RepID=A0AAN9TDC4_9HEMI
MDVEMRNTILTAPHFAPVPAGYAPFPPTALLGPIGGTRAPPPPAYPPPFTPVLYWACPSPPVSPPHQPALVIMQGTPPPPPYAGHHELTNFIHSVSEGSVGQWEPPGNRNHLHYFPANRPTKTATLHVNSASGPPHFEAKKFSIA